MTEENATEAGLDGLLEWEIDETFDLVELALAQERAHPEPRTGARQISAVRIAEVLGLPSPTAAAGGDRGAARAGDRRRRRRQRQDRDDGEPGGLAARQRARARSGDPRPHLHPQGGGRAGAAHPQAHRAARRRRRLTDLRVRSLRRADGRDLQLVRQHHLPRQRAADRPGAGVAVAQRGVGVAARPPTGRDEHGRPTGRARTRASTSSRARCSRSAGRSARTWSSPPTWSGSIERFAGLAELPTGSRRSRRRTDRSDDAIAVVGSLPPLLDLAVQFDAEKRRRGFVEFSDQVALALRVQREAPGASSTTTASATGSSCSTSTRTRRVVQTRLLSTAVRRSAVMAVGDPHQSIYGWRGASAANLGRFSLDFPAPGTAPPSYALSTSWRNPTGVLDAANTLVGPLSAGSPVHVERLEPRPGADAGAARRRVRARPSTTRPTPSPTGWPRDSAQRDDDGRGPQRRACCSARSRHMELFTEALRRARHPVPRARLGGLLSSSPRSSISSAPCASCTTRPPAPSSSACSPARAGGSARATSPRCDASRPGWPRPGPPAAGRSTPRCASGCAHRSPSTTPRRSSTPSTSSSTRPPGHRQLAGFSEIGPRTAARRRQPPRLPALPRRPRPARPRHASSSRSCCSTSRSRRTSGNQLGQANLYAFHDAGRRLPGAPTNTATLGSFLAWLAEAEKARRPRPAQRRPPSRHRAAAHHPRLEGPRVGLVAVPGMVEAELPGAPRREAAGWPSASCPTSSAATRRELPVLAWRTAATQQEFDDGRSRLSRTRSSSAHAPRSAGSPTSPSPARKREPAADRRRSGRRQTKPREPEPFLLELAGGRSSGRGRVPGGDRARRESVAARHADRSSWPLDPLGTPPGAAWSRRPNAVRSRPRATDPRARTPWTPTTSTCCSPSARAERPRPNSSSCRARIPASRFKDYVTDPATVAAAPAPPDAGAAVPRDASRHALPQLGRAAATGGRRRVGPDRRRPRAELDDAGRRRRSTRARPLAELQRTFERSEWADRRPEDVEIEIHLALAGQVFVCKLDAVYPARRHGVPGRRLEDGQGARDADDLELKQLQLALYRLAYARWKGVDPEPSTPSSTSWPTTGSSDRSASTPRRSCARSGLRRRASYRRRDRSRPSCGRRGCGRASPPRRRRP